MIHSHDFRERKDSSSDNSTPDKHTDHPLQDKFCRYQYDWPDDDWPDGVLEKGHNRMDLLEREAY